MKQEFYSNGKLLLTGEYLVLDGAKSLGLPTSFGQSMTVEASAQKHIVWKSYSSDNQLWLNEFFTWNNQLEFSSESQQPETLVLLKAFNWIAAQHPQLFSKNGYEFSSKLHFPNNWGLGSSSTFVNNLAMWSHTDAYQLQELLFGGSGYDIACAKNNSPILFQRNSPSPIVEEVVFQPPFLDELFFVHLNQKKNSREAIQHYRAQTALFIEDAILRIDDITQQIIHSKEISTFEKLIKSHEKIIATLLQTPPIQQTTFPDYPRQIKSLGGWGGDFILATGGQTEKAYFKEKGFTTLLSYQEMLLL